MFNMKWCLFILSLIFLMSSSTFARIPSTTQRLTQLEKDVKTLDLRTIEIQKVIEEILKEKPVLVKQCFCFLQVSAVGIDRVFYDEDSIELKTKVKILEKCVKSPIYPKSLCSKDKIECECVDVVSDT